MDVSVLHFLIRSVRAAHDLVEARAVVVLDLLEEDSVELVVGLATFFDLGHFVGQLIGLRSDLRLPVFRSWSLGLCLGGHLVFATPGISNLIYTI